MYTGLHRCIGTNFNSCNRQQNLGYEHALKYGHLSPVFYASILVSLLLPRNTMPTATRHNTQCELCRTHREDILSTVHMYSTPLGLTKYL